MKKVLVALCAILLGAGLAVAVEAPAYADFENCGAARLCTYTAAHGTGTLYYYTGPQNTCINIGGGLNDTMSSVKNTFSVHVTLYRDYGCANTFWKAGLGILPCTCAYYENLGSILMDNVMSSIWIGNSPPA